MPFIMIIGEMSHLRSFSALFCLILKTTLCANSAIFPILQRRTLKLRGDRQSTYNQKRQNQDLNLSHLTLQSKLIITRSVNYLAIQMPHLILRYYLICHYIPLMQTMSLKFFELQILQLVQFSTRSNFTFQVTYSNVQNVFGHLKWEKGQCYCLGKGQGCC